MLLKSSLRRAARARCAAEKHLEASPRVRRMSLAAASVLRRAALNAVRLNTFAPARSLATAPKKPAAELTFKEAWLSDPATYPIVVIISSP